MVSRPPIPTGPGPALLVLFVALLAASGCGGSEPETSEPARTAAAAPHANPPSTRETSDSAPTWSGEIADLVHRRCSVCHRPGEAGPFSLLTYADLKKRARQVAIVTADRFMPPWLPSPEGPRFRDDRSLTPEEIELFQRWARAGAPLGDPERVPPVPSFPEGWQLGTPDLVVRLPEPFPLPAEGRDVYRNFVLPRPAAGTHYVRAVEWRPDDRFVVHHAVLFADRTGGALPLDLEDELPGFSGMSPGPAQVPDGIFVGWAPGKVAHPAPAGAAWRLDERTDLVMQLHMRPTGKPEPVNVTLGFFYADAPPERHPVGIRLLSYDIDLPAGADDVHVTDSYRLPVDLDVLGVYPHAHYLGKHLRGSATLPDGSEQLLFDIPRWDFNWQDEYTYETPVHLPAGSVLRMDYSFDNTSENPLNPNQPPKRVTYGEQSSDEMAELLLLVLPAEEDLPILWRDFARKILEDNVAHVEKLAEQEPDRPAWQAQLGSQALKAGNFDEAIRRYRRVVELRPKRPRPLANLGHAQFLAGHLQDAVATFRRVLDLEPKHVAARVELGRALTRLGDPAGARAAIERALEDAPGFAAGEIALGELEARLGNSSAAESAYRAALATNPDETGAMWRLGMVLEGVGRDEEAEELYRRALSVFPDETEAHHRLGLLLARNGKHEEGVRHLEIAVRLAPARSDLAAALARIRGGS